MAHDHPTHLSRRGMFQVMLGRPAEDPAQATGETAATWRDQGWRAAGAGDLDGAAESLRHWLRRTPGDDESRMLYGRILYAKGRHVQALVEFERVARRVAGHPAGLYLCLCRARLGRTEKALEAYTDWAQANAQEPDAAWGDLPALLADPGRAAEAVLALERGLGAGESATFAGSQA